MHEAQLKCLTRRARERVAAFPGPAYCLAAMPRSDHATHAPEPLKVYMRPLIICVPVTMAPEGDR